MVVVVVAVVHEIAAYEPAHDICSSSNFRPPGGPNGEQFPAGCVAPIWVGCVLCWISLRMLFSDEDDNDCGGGVLAVQDGDDAFVCVCGFVMRCFSRRSCVQVWSDSGRIWGFGRMRGMH